MPFSPQTRRPSRQAIRSRSCYARACHLVLSLKTELSDIQAPMSKLSHYDDAGQAHMVDVSAKSQTRREAVAEAFVELSAQTLEALPQNPKGNPLEVARFAGIQAAKQ